MADERGAATLLGCLVITASIAVTALFAQLGVAVVARHRVQSAADLGALAVAGTLTSGVSVACAEGEDLVRRMGMRMRTCEVVEWDALVTVETRVSMGVFGVRDVRASARAGPVDEEG